MNIDDFTALVRETLPFAEPWADESGEVTFHVGPWFFRALPERPEHEAWLKLVNGQDELAVAAPLTYRTYLSCLGAIIQSEMRVDGLRRRAEDGDADAQEEWIAHCEAQPTEALETVAERYAPALEAWRQKYGGPPLHGDGVYDDTEALQARIDAASEYKARAERIDYGTGNHIGPSPERVALAKRS